jgi:hypothetical protein
MNTFENILIKKYKKSNFIYKFIKKYQLLNIF